MKKNRIHTVLEMIKFEHSVFALPFALTGALLAARASRNDWPTLWQVVWIVVAMVAARSAAMTGNRIADLRYDRENPRTNNCARAMDRANDARRGYRATRLVGLDFRASLAGVGGRRCGRSSARL